MRFRRVFCSRYSGKRLFFLLLSNAAVFAGCHFVAVAKENAEVAATVESAGIDDEADGVVGVVGPGPSVIHQAGRRGEGPDVVAVLPGVIGLSVEDGGIQGRAGDDVPECVAVQDGERAVGEDDLDLGAEPGRAQPARGDGDHEAVAAFLQDRIGFYDIARIAEGCINGLNFVANPTLDDIFATNEETVAKSKEML